MRPPNKIREDIADLLGLSQEDRENLHTISIASLVESLIEYTHRLENELQAKKKKSKIAI